MLKITLFVPLPRKSAVPYRAFISAGSNQSAPLRSVNQRSNEDLLPWLLICEIHNRLPLPKMYSHNDKDTLVVSYRETSLVILQLNSIPYNSHPQQVRSLIPNKLIQDFLSMACYATLVMPDVPNDLNIAILRLMWKTLQETGKRTGKF